MTADARAEGPLRVLLCATGFPRHADDPHKPFLLDHARALQGAGLEVIVLCPGGLGLAAKGEVDGIEVLRFRYGPRRMETLAYDGAMYRRAAGRGAVAVPGLVASFTAAAVATARRRSVDVVHGHWWVPAGAVAVAAARASGAVSVVHVHGSDAAIARGPLRAMAGQVLGRAGAVLVASDELAAWAGGVAGGRQVWTVPMPLGTARLPTPSPPTPGGPVVAVGRLVPEKGFDILLRAAALVDQRVLIVGDGPLRAELAALAVELGVDLTLTGAVPPSQLGSWLQASSVVAVPSRREGFGLVAAEAAYCGRAVVGSDVGGLRAMVDDGVSGILVPPGDVAALAAALARIDPAVGQHGPARVRWLEPDAHAAAVVKAYRAAMELRRG